MHETSKERFRLAYEANYPRILGYVLRRTSSPEDAADVVADTFATAWRKLDQMPDGDEATLWLYAVARKVLANHHRKEVKRSEVMQMLVRDYEELIWHDPLPAVSAEGSALAEAWLALRDQDRDLLGLLVWETLTTEQAAAVLCCSRSIAKLRIHRARRRLARELERRGVELKPAAVTRHVQVGRAGAHPDTEAM
ncbi:MAG: RNA polymerase sigma factor [Actinobacteria bacterium]|nr:RNA polymerase sigma factor [Actinomycetota bacterium]